MFSKILIANRGEIAARIIRTAQRMGISTVAVYSEADRNALFVEMADEAVFIGPAPAAQSYLVIEKIVQAARETGAEAVHPGYGFLAENPRLVAALDEAGIAFIGPPAHAIAAMGDKIVSKKLAQEAGVAIIPGHAAAIENAAEARRIAKDIGFPVMIKAAAGGGGKGMRIARRVRELEEGLNSAAREAKSSFGDARVFIEKYIETPRHIEIQVLADAHGTVLHLGERECSVQRRHQKVIEEAPSPFLDADTRAAMAAQAVALAQAVDYASAGTVEFIVDAERHFYFLEMNTRLQVEHPVTELVTGTDLVEQMIRVAAGEKLAIAQADIAAKGWAIEARIYAEDPRRDFLPATGRLTRFHSPEGEGIRLDSGVREGDEISLYYDPMIAKLCAHGIDRDTAIARLAMALDETVIRGPGHNLSFLAATVRHPRFRAGDISTTFIDEAYGGGFAGPAIEGDLRDRLICLAILVHHREAARRDRFDGEGAWVVALNGMQVPVTVRRENDGYGVDVEGARHHIAGDWRPGALVFRGRIDDVPIAAGIEASGLDWRIEHAGARVEATVLDVKTARYAAMMPEKRQADVSGQLRCPMPGLVVAITTREGEAVKAGQPLAVVEAMKMENVLRADVDGIVAKIFAAPGDSLSLDAVILELEPAGE